MQKSNSRHERLIPLWAALLAALAMAGCSRACLAHATAGERVFPATIAVDDPGVNDELDSQLGRSFDSDSRTTAVSAEFDKRLTENFGLSLSGAWLDQSGTTGFDNIGLGAKYTFYKNAEHEAIFSAGLDWDIGNTGARRVADDYSTLTPTLYAGKGMGDLPDSADFLKPFAVTGSLGLGVPTRRYSPQDDGTVFNPDSLEWGGTLQYSIPYLQQHVKDVGIPSPFNTAVPVVEFAMATPTGGDDRRTTGTVNPGILFMGTDIQFGFEAVVPVNHASGEHVGGIFQLHFYLDNLFPETMKPLW